MIIIEPQKTTTSVRSHSNRKTRMENRLETLNVMVSLKEKE